MVISGHVANKEIAKTTSDQLHLANNFCVYIAQVSWNSFN